MDGTTIKMNKSNTLLFEPMINCYLKSKKPITISFKNLVGNNITNNRYTHLIHSYPAKLIPHIPYAFLNSDILSSSKRILDPFSGTGTVLLEGIISGKYVFGADCNPLARLISRVKTNYIDPEMLNYALHALIKPHNDNNNIFECNSVDLSRWFYPHIIRQLSELKAKIELINDQDLKDFFWVSFSTTVRKVSLANPRLSVPVRINYKKYPSSSPIFHSLKKQENVLKRINVSKLFSKIAVNNINRISTLSNISKTKHIAISNDARNIRYNNNRKVKKNSIDVVLTSPPYAGAQKYIRASQLNLAWLGMIDTSIQDIRSNCIGRELFPKKAYCEYAPTGIPLADAHLEKIFKINPLRAYILSKYFAEMKESFVEFKRLLSNNGYLILILGNNTVCGQPFETVEHIKSMLISMNFKLQLEFIDDIKSRGLMTKRNKTAGIIGSEHVLIFNK